jgi:hypothetical protein
MATMQYKSNNSLNDSSNIIIDIFQSDKNSEKPINNTRGNPCIRKTGNS